MAGFKGGFGGGGMNMQQMMRQAQKMQEEMQRAQEELEETEVTGSAGGDMVTVTLNGKKKFISISIKPEAAEDVEMLEDLISAAMNEAYEKASELEKSVSPLGGIM